MKAKVIVFSKFIVAVIVCFILASIAHSQFVLAGLTGIGVEIATSDRISMTVSDIGGLAIGYGSVVFIALGTGFLIINAVSRWVLPLPKLRYPLAGFLAIGGALLAMQPLLNVTLIAGAREPLGFFLQCVAGLVGGYVFMTLMQKNSSNGHDTAGS